MVQNGQRSSFGCAVTHWVSAALAAAAVAVVIGSATVSGLPGVRPTDR
ncbi:hypothetical protein PV367_08910 [Streptomyces europaeiscabiei]|uniref:Uncharacterized protein n=1 Tax=Streptomyces europaeiscabiei TaxID=146819 RepID=A0AAJ2UKJ1_9ACTN|nr:hypothetical protein [Streptomyces europaeiscabiei]MDX3129915.1 hypothetical protein [Streptomyces europaeiscabiei]